MKLKLYSVQDACEDPDLFCETFGCQRVKPKPASWPAYRASVGEFPFAVALSYEKRYDGEDEFKCNGVLISEKFVVTTAVCITTLTPKLVRLGKVRKLLKIIFFQI